MSFRTILIVVNLVAIAALIGFIVYRVVSLRRNPHHREPENLTPFFDDDVMEGAHLERALGVALVALVVILVGMVVYFMREPFRSDEAQRLLQGPVGRARRGALRGAAVGGVQLHRVAAVRAVPRPRRRRRRRAERRSSRAPTRGATRRRRSTRSSPRSSRTACRSRWRGRRPTCSSPRCATRAAQLTQIITFGRPGTPMPAWGVLSGVGALNAQSIKDLVNYVESLSTTSDKAKALAAKDVERTSPRSMNDPAVSRGRRRLGRPRRPRRWRRRRPSLRGRRPLTRSADAAPDRAGVPRLHAAEPPGRHRVARRGRSTRPTARSSS